MNSGLDQEVHRILSVCPVILYRGALGLLRSHNFSSMSWDPEMNKFSLVFDQFTDETQPECDVNIALTREPSVK
jgi:hypothetical protein